MTPLSERAKILLDLAGWSVTTLAEIAGVKPPSVSDWLNGKTKSLKGTPAARISNRFKLNPVWVAEALVAKGLLAKNDLLNALTVLSYDSPLPQQVFLDLQKQVAALSDRSS